MGEPVVKHHELPKPITAEQKYMAAILEMLVLQQQTFQALIEMVAPALAEPEQSEVRETPTNRVQFADGTFGEMR